MMRAPRQRIGARRIRVYELSYTYGRVRAMRAAAVPTAAMRTAPWTDRRER